MFNIIVKKYGDPDTLLFEKGDVKKLNHDSVRINVKSIGVNYADILLIKGKYQERPRPPFSPGLEISGIVSETGNLAKTFKVGDRVMSIMKYGGYKTEVVIPQENTYFIPERHGLYRSWRFSCSLWNSF